MAFLDLQVADLERVNVPVQVNKLLSSKTIWINRKSNLPLDDTGVLNTAFISEEKFLDLFSYVVSDSKLFNGADIDTRQIETWYAERYGGQGCAGNAGGARVVHNGKFQLKGNGANCLVNSGIGHYHRYGGLDLHSATQEIIYTNVFNRILPIGVANIYGMISTELKCGHYGSKEVFMTWGVILVRETLVRPSHFLRAIGVEPLEEYRSLLSIGSDVARVRGTNRQLKKFYVSDKEFIKQIGKFLANWANQLAFSRVARISHASLIASNVTLQGKWIDVAGSSFNHSGYNVDRTNGIFWAFMEEPALIAEIAKEMLYTYCKYNNTTINQNILLKYFESQFDAYYRFHIQFLVCIGHQEINHGIVGSDWEKIYEIFRNIIDVHTKEYGPEYTSASKDDPVAVLIEDCFLSSAGYVVKNPNDCLDAFSKVLANAYGNCKEKNRSFKGFTISRAISAIKKSRLSFIYFPLIMEKELLQACHNESAVLAADVIEMYENLTEWIYEDITQDFITLFKSTTMKVVYSPGSREYRIEIHGLPTQTASSFNEALLNVSVIDPMHYSIGSFDFSLYFDSLSRVIPELEHLIP